MDAGSGAGAPPGFRHHVAEIGGVRLHCLVADGRAEAAPAVVLLHGWPETCRAWRKVAPLLAARGFAVVAPDLRGLGASSRPPGGYDKKTVAAEIHGLVASLGHRTVTLVGHDIGGMVAYAYAAQWPAEVERLVALECLLPGFGLDELFRAQEGRFAHMPFHMAPDLPEALVAGREALYLGWFFRNLTWDQDAFTAGEIEAYVRDYAQTGALRAGFEHYRAFWRDAEDNRAFAARGKLPMPVLAIGSGLVVRDGLGSSLEGVAADVRSVVFEGCGHFISAEQPGRLAEEILTFQGERR